MKKIVFLTGAGMSVEDGSKILRGSDGLWENYPVEQAATYEGWEADLTLVTSFYNMLRKKLYAAKPNEGHRLIQQLEEAYDVTVIIRNVDSLYGRTGSSGIIHLYGELAKVCSSCDPYNEAYIRELPQESRTVEPGIKTDGGSLLCPFTVFFGESVPMISVAAEHAREVDTFVIIGTSLNVYPAAGLIQYTKPNCPTYLTDPESVRTSDIRHFKHIQKGVSEGMEELMKVLESDQQRTSLPYQLTTVCVHSC